MIEQFHFLRPAWLLLLPLLALLSWWLVSRAYDAGRWRAVIDQRLLPHLLRAGAGGGVGPLGLALAAAAALAIVALAGPTWERLPQPVYRQQSALVIALDLSRSMDAADIRPSRLARARLKIVDILQQRREGQTALVVYAADAFTVTPLTSDTDTIINLLPALDSGIMPAQGTRADRAVELALELLDNSGATRGDLLLISDGIGDAELGRVADLLAARPGLRLSVLAVGTTDGGPVPLASGGFLKDSDGAIVIADLKEHNLHEAARVGGGAYAAISADDLDINALTYVVESGSDSGEARPSDRAADLWRELGPWLLLPVLPLAALAFRRGLIWMLPLAVLALPPDAHALDWQSLWQNPDQRASRLFEQGDPAAAARLFDDDAWRASAQYRAGDFAAALATWSGLDSEDAMYNRGTALARLGRYGEALAAYDALLERNPAHADARFNKAAIEEWLRQQQQQKQGGGEGQAGNRPQDRPDQRQDQRQEQPGQPQGQPGEGDKSQAEAGDRGDAESSPAQQSAQSGQSGQAAGSPDDRQDAGAAPRAGADGEPRAPEDDPGRGDPQRADELMSAQAAEQWLRKIPDDPGGLLRRKFLYQYRQRGGVDAEAQSW